MVEAQNRLREVTRMFADFQRKKKRSSSLVMKTMDGVTKTEDCESAYDHFPSSSTPKSKTKSSLRNSLRLAVKSEENLAKNIKSSIKAKRKKPAVLKTSLTRSSYMAVTKTQCENTCEGDLPKAKRKRGQPSLKSRTRTTEVTKTEEAYETTRAQDENLPPQAKYGKDCIDQREYDAKEKESFEVVQNARPATTHFRNKELRWKDVEEMFDDAHERERFLLSLKVLSIMNNYKLLDESLKPEEKETLRSYFTSTSNDKPTTNIIELLDRSIGSALKAMRHHPDRFHGEVNENMRRFIMNSRKVKPVLLETMMMFPENIPESWGGNFYNKNVTAKLAEKKDGRKSGSSLTEASDVKKGQQEKLLSKEKVLSQERQGVSNDAQAKKTSTEQEQGGDIGVREKKMNQKECDRVGKVFSKEGMVKQQSHEKLDEVKGIKKYKKDDKKNEAQMHHKEGDEGRKEAEGEKNTQIKKTTLEKISAEKARISKEHHEIGEEKELEVKRTMSEPNIPGSEKPTEEDSETEEKKKSDDLGSKEKKS